MKVRLAVFLPAGPVPSWVVRLVGDCAALPGITLVGLLRDSATLPEPDWADRVDELVFDRGASPLRHVSLVAPEGVAEWRPELGTPSAWLAGQGCDVLLDLRAAPALLADGPAEQWTLMLAGRPAVDPLAGAAPVVTGSDSTVIRLEALRGGEVLDASLGASCTFSIRRNRRRAIAKGMGMVRRALLRLADDGMTPRGRSTVPATAPASAAATGATTRFATLLQRTVSRSAVKALSREQWGLALAFGDEICLDPARATLIEPPADRFWADPMVWPAEGGGWWVFIEEVIYKEGKGTLKAIRVKPDRSWAPPVPVMERPWHLSYPFLFAWNGALWMVPESGANRSVELYRCVGLPDKWEKAADILTGIDMVDATLFEHDGRWWLLGNVTEPGADKHDELHAYYADSPFGPWQPHAANPVVADARFARPAGPLFEHDGKLLRPAQVCVPEYGHALSLRRIETLTPTEYVEHTEQRIDPGWQPGIACVHTLSHQAGLTVFDYLTRRSRFAAVRGRRPVAYTTRAPEGAGDNSDGTKAQ
ncbi:hypothetical protein [Zoogloea sp.]|uniref:glucosamine inositolphosphorylceramide transferase family protein n=1 Tax=Zoogloea sp. TaxID=49181 RepID=UPI0035AE2FF2